MALSDSDWSAGPWESTCQTRLVRQRLPTDCGVACLAMVSGIGYEHAAQVFVKLGLDRPPRPFNSNFTDLIAALQLVGTSPSMLRWRSWDQFSGLGVIKVSVKVSGKTAPSRRMWHWVVAERHAELGLIIRDPACPLAAIERPPLSVNYQECGNYEPTGNWIKVDPMQAPRGLKGCIPGGQLELLV